MGTAPRCGDPRSAAKVYPMIKVDCLTKTYGRFTAVDDVTFTARPAG